MFKYLFFDDQRLLLRDNLKREYGRPQAIPESVYKAQGETGAGLPCIWEAPDGKYHMFYFETPVVDDANDLGNLEPGGVVCAAISDDGIHFKPRNTADEAGVKNPKFKNQVVDYFEGEFCSVFVDEYAPEDERLKLLYNEHDIENCHLMCKMYVSGDGIKWRRKTETVWNAFGAEMGHVCYNPIRNTYIISTRPDGGVRRSAVYETRDWMCFGENLVCLQCDSIDPPLVELYGMLPIYYDGMFISLIWMFYTDTSYHGTKFQGGPIKVQLGYSFNGIHWQRSLRDSFMDGDNDKEILGYENKMVFASDVKRTQNGDIRITAATSKCEHGSGFRQKGSGAIVQYALREDDFIHLTTEDNTKPSLICTRDNRWFGGELSINIKCKKATVALYDRSNKIYEGYSHEDCIPFSGDSKNWIPCWNGKTMQDFKDKIVQIEIRFEDGTLYSVSGNCRPMMDLESCRWQDKGYDNTRKGI